MKCIWINQNGGSKMADASNSFFGNKWCHHDITAIVKDYLCISLTIKWFLLYVYFEGQITSMSQSSYAQKLEMMSTLLCVILWP